VFQRLSSAGIATLVLLDTAACDYDRKTYPTAAHAALIRSGDAALTEALLSELPADSGIVFKLCCTAERDVVHGTIRSRARPASCRSHRQSAPGSRRRHRRDSATDAMYALYRMQDHERGLAVAALASGRAFTCAIGSGENRSPSASAFELWRVWEIGGVVTRPDQRGRGLGSRVVGAALDELARRGLIARYQVHEDNTASIRLAERSV
jgi:GNAT superfamily N-acetyltransferase